MSAKKKLTLVYGMSFVSPYFGVDQEVPKQKVWITKRSKTRPPAQHTTFNGNTNLEPIERESPMPLDIFTQDLTREELTMKMDWLKIRALEIFDALD